jgi:argininosuccinate lyase
LTTMKGLPLAYNKDMQEDKEALFDSAQTVLMCLKVMGSLLGEVSFKSDTLKAATEKGYLVATDLADYLVGKGITFREAHEVVGKMVVFAIESGRELHELSLEEMKGYNRQIEKDVYAWLDPQLTVGRRNIPGGTGPDAVRNEIEAAKLELGLGDG